MNKYRKKRINKLRKPYYVADEYGHTDETLVGKANEMIDVINRLQDEVVELRKLLQGGK